MVAQRALKGKTVLNLLQEGLDVNQIAERCNTKLSAIQSHVYRLVKRGKWQSKKQVVTPIQVDYDSLFDTFLKKLESHVALENELETLKDDKYKLQNILAATKNELSVALDEVKRKSEMSGRLKIITDKLNQDRVKQLEGATH